MSFRHTANFDPVSRRTISESISHQKQCQLDDQFIDRLDNTEILGGEDATGLTIGHTGCVNALSWSPSGQLLASGSDDRNVVLWKLGSDHLHPAADFGSSSRQRSSSSRYRIGAARRADASQPALTGPIHDPDGSLAAASDDLDEDDDIVQQWPQRSYPKMGLGMLGKIESGHRANIFSVKWAPNASERRLFTCAGDSHVRVFDINYASTGASYGADAVEQQASGGRTYSVWPEHSGACIRLFRCHKGRAKRISTEVSPDVFLTCGEDGDVRQMDLRVPHTCRTRSGGSCPSPLAHYNSVLYSLSVSKSEPWLFAVAGESPLAHLHDRRMIPRLIKRDWGMTTDPDDDALTMCVRSFGIPPGGFESPWAQADGRTALVNDAPSQSRRLLMANRNSITACKISEANGRDLLVSYSNGHIYRFDIYDQPGLLHANLDQVRFSLDTDEEGTQSPEGNVAPADDDPISPTDGDWDHQGTEDAKGRPDVQSEVEDESVVVTNERDIESQVIDNHGDVHSDDNGDSDAMDDHNDVVDDVDEDGTDDGDDDDGDDDDNDDDDNDDDDDDDDEDEEDEEDFFLQEDALEASDNAKTPTVYPRTAYKGHCNKETVKDVAFGGKDDACVMSGSDDGNLFMWDKHTAQIRGIWRADSSVVNVVSMHPDLPLFAVSGIDDTVKIFAPASITPFPLKTADEDLDVEENVAEPPSKKARNERCNLDRSLKVADRLADKEEICARNERQLQRDFARPAANVLWRLYPSLLGVDVDNDDPESQIEGDCIVM